MASGMVAPFLYRSSRIRKNGISGQWDRPGLVSGKPTFQELSDMAKIDKKEDQYILLNKEKKSSYKLDDATKAEKFNGDDVKVVGTLDASTNMIHVQSIEKAHN
jgi:hypothetical protein